MYKRIKIVEELLEFLVNEEMQANSLDEEKYLIYCELMTKLTSFFLFEADLRSFLYKN